MYRISCPSKTFLMGEYAVLDGGHGIIVSTGPRFQMSFEKVKDDFEESFIEGISPQGPVMDFLRDNLDVFSHYKIHMYDPHEHRGGFGWSSAQFLFLYTLKAWHEQGQDLKLPSIDRASLLYDFLSYSWDGEGWAPSGLDILSQLEGGLVFLQSPRKVKDGKFEPIEFGEYQKIPNWPFQDIQFCLLRTGNKVATHSHLSNLHNLGTSKLGKISFDTGQSLLQNDEDAFIDNVNLFREALSEEDLIDLASWSLQQQLLQRPEVVAIKGCGALGADVLLVLIVSELMEEFKEYVREEGYFVVSDSFDIQDGLRLEVSKNDDYDGAAK